MDDPLSQHKGRVVQLCIRLANPLLDVRSCFTTFGEAEHQLTLSIASCPIESNSDLAGKGITRLTV
jgi:hypothetical protein